VVFAVEAMCVAVFVAVTVALGIDAPCAASTTDPKIVAVDALCANAIPADPATSSVRATTQNSQELLFLDPCISFSPFESERCPDPYKPLSLQTAAMGTRTLHAF